MKCTKCHTENPDERKFCRECGSKLAFICPKCGAENLPTDKFCGECSHDLVAPKEVSPIDYDQPQSYTPKFLADKILTTRSAIEGERKLVTVLFADVANYTSIAEKLDPEVVHEIMDGCFRIMIDEIHKYEGTINQFTGDGVMALFGAPVAHEDHAQRACSAALAIQEALEGYGKELKETQHLEFKVRIGINSGSVVVGSIGDDLRMDYTAIGDTSNLASRIQTMARPGATLISQNTYKKASQYFECTSLGKVEVKGKERPQQIYELVKDKKYRPRLGYERRIYSEMVGRDRELNKVELQVMKVINGDGSIVNIIGEAGIGKSRLVAEFKRREVMKRVNLLEGRAISMGRSLSFHPIIDILKNWAQIREDDGDAAAFSKLETAVRSVHPEEANEIITFVATLMGIRLSGSYAERVNGIGGEALEKLILKNVRALLIKAAELTPLVIVIEDLHWADTSSLELMESMFRLAETQPILFVNVFRPGHKETGDRIVEDIIEKLPVYNLEIILEPLDDRMSEMLINNMVNIRGFHQAVTNQIVLRAGGNPFFIEEVVHSFIDEGVVVSKRGGFEVTDKIHTVIIPETIIEVLISRIDRLEEETRELLKVASVIGRSFFHRVLAEVAGMVGDIDSRLSYLKDVQIIRVRRRMDEVEYLFKHALMQEATYNSILVQRRKELHLRVAESIENIFSGRLHGFYGMLAYHYGTGENLEKAEDYMAKAGKEALKSSASSEALYYYQNALELYIRKYKDTVDPERLSKLEENLGLAFYLRGHYVEAIEYFDRALGNLGFKEPRTKILVSISLIINLLLLLRNFYIPSIRRKKKIPSNLINRIHNILFNRAQALTLVDVKRMFFTAIRDGIQCFKYDLSKSQLHFNILSALGAAFTFSGISLTIGKRILDYSRKSVPSKGEDISLHVYVFSEAIHNFLSGNWHGESDESVVDYDLKIGDLYTASYTLSWWGHRYIELGDFEVSERIIKKLDDISDEFSYDNAKLLFYELTSYLLIRKRELENVLPYLNESIALLGRMGLELRIIHPLGMKSCVQVMQDDLSAAEKTFDEATNLVLQIGAKKIAPFRYSSYIRGLFLFNLAKLERYSISADNQNIVKLRKTIKKIAKKALKNSKKVASVRPEVNRMMGTYFWLINEQKNALKWWDKSIQEGEHLGARIELARTYMEIGKWLLEEKSKFKELNRISTKEYLEKARIMFEEMDLQWDLDELDKIIGYNQGK